MLEAGFHSEILTEFPAPPSKRRGYTVRAGLLAHDCRSRPSRFAGPVTYLRGHLVDYSGGATSVSHRLPYSPNPDKTPRLGTRLPICKLRLEYMNIGRCIKGKKPQIAGSVAPCVCKNPGNLPLKGIFFSDLFCTCVCCLTVYLCAQ